MKAIMYHYVRPNSSHMPWLRYLRLEDFCKQLDFFNDRYKLLGREEFLESVRSSRPCDEGVVLTFDDGLSDHFLYVLPELVKRRLWGIFYIPTSPLRHPKTLLQVHRIHALIGALGGGRVLRELIPLLSSEDLAFEHVQEFRHLTYSRQENDQATNMVKRILNYFVSPTQQEILLNTLMDRFFDESVLAEKWYMNVPQLCSLRDSGMLIGSHTVKHQVMSKLTGDEQTKEILNSFQALEEELGEQNIRTFSYPYGGFHTFDALTEAALSQSGCLFSFNVEMRDISKEDLKKRPQALPRYDCNQFPNGAAAPISPPNGDS